MPIDFVSADEAPVMTLDGSKTGVRLLWGDRVNVLGTVGANAKIQTGRFFGTGLVKQAHLGGQSLLELYFIDVGQGDGVLIRTPDHRHVLIDGGFPRNRQPTRKNAADFVDWKFVKDYRKKTIALDAVIASHNDADHYGGLWDLLSDDPDTKTELDADKVTVEAFYHAGMSWWKKGSSRTLGSFLSTPDGEMWTDLLGDRASAEAALGTGSGLKLAGEWAKFIDAVVATAKSNGAKTTIRRLSHVDGHVPGFGPAPGQASIKVLAPVEFDVSGKPALRRFKGGESINTNGQSVLLRVDYGRARIILTGDLNSAAQGALLDDYVGQVQELECDVAKACHHGSDDVSYRFLQALHPAVTVISSGDNEAHDHPRPGIVAASATTGFLSLSEDRIVSPLIYSTELARSLKLDRAESLEVEDASGATLEVKGKKLAKTKVILPKKPGKTKAPFRTLDKAFIVSGLVYGLVNVRTDGNRILCATMNEADRSWQIKIIQSRF